MYKFYFWLFYYYSNESSLQGALESGKLNWFVISLFGFEIIITFTQIKCFERGPLFYITQISWYQILLLKNYTPFKPPWLLSRGVFIKIFNQLKSDLKIGGQLKKKWFVLLEHILNIVSLLFIWCALQRQSVTHENGVGTLLKKEHCLVTKRCLF